MRDFKLERYFSKWEFKSEFHMTGASQKLIRDKFIEMHHPICID